MARSPIAIVGRSCLLPGASSPEALWDIVTSQRDATTPVPRDRWGAPLEDILTSPDRPKADHAWSDRGGYVRGFELDARGLHLEASLLAELDPLFQWVLHCGREALECLPAAPRARVGAVFGILGFPCAKMARYAEREWLGDSGLSLGPVVAPHNRFQSGLPMLLLEKALGLGAGGFALDAACASSLYAIQFACERLQAGLADVMLAGGVNCADDLFIHVGFSALSALSRTGQSRPFHADADGLVPAEGAACVALKRLSDAERDGDVIFGVIRGVGLSNDGRGKGFLVPSQAGQVRAIREAYARAEMSPDEVTLLECHATGTPVGDATELAGLCEVFRDRRDPLPLGSLKSNLGHAITAAGMAGLIKLTEALRHGTLPPNMPVEKPSAALSDAAGFRLLDASEPWHVARGRTRAAGLSAFGFGGNNAHLIVEQHRGRSALTVSAEPKKRPRIALVGVGAIAGKCGTRRQFASALASGASQLEVSTRGGLEGRAATIHVDIRAAGVPPTDIRQTLAQQLLMEQAAREAVADAGELPRARTGVFVGMGTDAEIGRYGARFRMSAHQNEGGARLGAGWIDEAKRALVGELSAAGVLGTMPNMPTNRLNRAFDFGGLSCSVFAEELSGLEALDLAAAALSDGSLDAALVGAVDMCCEPVHQSAARTLLGPEHQVPGDAAVALVLRRLDDAEADGQRVYAVFDPPGSDRAENTSGPPRQAFGELPGGTRLAPSFGHAHAASGLLHWAAAALSVASGCLPGGAPWLGPRRATVRASAMAGRAWQGSLDGHGEPKASDASSARLYVFRGPTTSAIVSAIERFFSSGALPDDGPSQAHAPMCLVVVAADPDELRVRLERASAHLTRSDQPLLGTAAGPGVYFRKAPVEGELAFVFTSAGAAYRGMGAELLRARPEVVSRVAARFSCLPEALGWAYGEGAADPTPSERLWGASALSQVHAELSLRTLGLVPTAAIGYSSGESNSLFAFGVWRDLDAMRDEFAEAQLFEREVGGHFSAVERAWGEPADWAVWTVVAPLEHVKALLAGEPRVHLAIVHTASECVISGDASRCEAIVRQVGAERCQPLAYNLAVHVPELEQTREAWLRVHRREVTPQPSVRFYTAATGAAYVPSEEACATAIYDQARATLDFPALIERAFADGVRVFVEHGPGAACSGWIREILGPRSADAVIVSLDRKGGGASSILACVAELLSAGVAVNADAWLADRSIASAPASPSPEVVVPSHPPRVQWPPMNVSTKPQTMEPAPPLPSAIDPIFLPARTAAAPAPPFPVARPPSSAAPRGSLIETFAKIAEVHASFLQQQAEVHQRFLRGRSAMESGALLTRSGGAPRLARSPVEPKAPPPLRAQHNRAAPIQAPPPVAPQHNPSAPLPPPSRGAPQASPPPPRTEAKAPLTDAPLAPLSPRGLSLNRAQLEVHASGKISEVFGPMFGQQDVFLRQVRMPEPPLLLADRVTGIDATPGVLGRGTLWSETDVTEDAWYLFRGRMPAGVMIESGQADLMLISYMGADFLNRSERVYRLLGCKLTYFGELPRPGETLTYDIHVDGHAQHGDVRLFFFHYDCRVGGELRLRVEGGQAGFFSDQELAESAGVVWTPEGQSVVAEPRRDAADVLSGRRSFDAEQVRAFAEGRPWACFGAGFEATEAHSFSPRIQPGRLLFLKTVPTFDPAGGPWGRGYLRAESPVSPSDWYFDGHFKNDPCMPGTLMFEGCIQTLSFYLAAMGFSVARDGWRFQPVTDEPIEMRCRGQVTPASKNLTYEVFVEEIIAGPQPTIFADVLCTVDGRKAFHARRVGLSLVPDWPLSAIPALVSDFREPKPVASATTPDGGTFELGYLSLLACAWGKPTEAFGPMYAQFDGPMGVPRLPGPPYHFMSRIVSVQGPMGQPKVGARVCVAYDIPEDAWYFSENGARTMPFCVLLEAALQPCGWLASYVGCALGESQVVFRNLDGTGTQHAEVHSDAGCLVTDAELTKVSRSAGMTLVGFRVRCRRGDTLVYEMETVFGFFPPSALQNQVGLPVGEAERESLRESPEAPRELKQGADVVHSARLAVGRLAMLDRVARYSPSSGPKGLGAMRAEKDVRAGDWYFKAHFFQDPVQPGSLGVEAMLQLLQLYMLEKGLDAGLTDPRFEPIALGAPLTWKYRGQVVPTNTRVTVTLDVTDVGRDERGAFAFATSSLWVDGIRIYEAKGLGMRLVEGAPPNGGGGGRAPLPRFITDSLAEAIDGLSPGAKRNRGAASRSAVVLRETLDPARSPWLSDHRPTYGRPALPMMALADLIARAAEGHLAPQRVTAMRDLTLSGWLDFTGPRTFEVELEPAGEAFRARVFATRDDGRDAVATALVFVGAWANAPLPEPSKGGDALSDPYESGALFHGPAFQLLRRGTLHESGATTWLDAGASHVPPERRVPIGVLHPALMDAGLHGIPHDHLEQWSSEIPSGLVGYPARILELVRYGAPPSSGMVRCEARFDGFLLKPDLPRFRLQWSTDAGVFLDVVLVEACFPAGRLGALPPLDRRAFLRDGHFVPGARLSRAKQGESRLSEAEAERSDFLPGTLHSIYGVSDAGRIAVHEHVAARERLHPRLIPAGLPLTRPRVVVTRDGDDFVVRDAQEGPERLDLGAVRAFWTERLGVAAPWLGSDLWEGLIQRFVERVVLSDPSGFGALFGRPAIYVANHQVQMESLLVTNLLSALSGTSLVTIANAKHETRWIGWLLRSLFSHPGCKDPGSIVYFDQARPDSMFALLADLKPRLARGERSLFLHAEGTRAQSCRERTTRLSSLFVDLAAELSLPIVPIRFRGGLPIEPVSGKLELPVGFGRQEIWVGSALTSEHLAALPYADRKRTILDAVNALGGKPEAESPSLPDASFEARAQRFMASLGVDEVRATLLATLEALAHPSEETQVLLELVRGGGAIPTDSPVGAWLAALSAELRRPAVEKMGA